MYWPWLVALSLAFLVLERLFPRRRDQPLLRSGSLRDLGFLAFNGYFFSVWTGPLNGTLAAGATSTLRSWGFGLDSSPISRWPLVTQFVVFLVFADLLQWGVHNLLHRVPWLWTFHRVHHSITTMQRSRG